MSMSIESDLAALQSLPRDVLARLIDPSGPIPSPAASDTRAELEAFKPSDGGELKSVPASIAYVKEMRRAADELQGKVVANMARDTDGERLEKIRNDAEIVAAAVKAYPA